MQDNKPYTINIRLVKDLYYTEGQFVQFLNILQRKCFQALDLQLLGRNYFDPKNNIKLNDWKLELWPGYVSSIRQHENKMLLCCEISHKILRQDTVLEQLRAIYRQSGSNYQVWPRLFVLSFFVLNFFKKNMLIFLQNAAQRILLDTIIITRYNNRTYKIDDVDFNSSPSHTFPRRDGTEISYVQYFKERYNLNIQDKQQPMLVSNPTKADVRRGFTHQVYLVPEFCHMTGLSDEQRANFKLMKVRH